MWKSSKTMISASIAACFLSVLMINSASAVENTIGWKTMNPGRNDVFDLYDATRTALPDSSGIVEWKTSNPGRTEVFDAYTATRASTPESTGAVRINTTNAHRNDVYDLYSK